MASDDEEKDPARRRKLEELEGEIKRAFAQSRAQSVAAFDQFHGLLEGLGHTMDQVAGSDLPPGHRIRLIRATASLLSSVTLQLDLEEQFEPGKTDVYLQTLGVLHGLIGDVLERRLEARGKHLAWELAGDDMDLGERYSLVAEDPYLQRELIQDAGWDPPNAAIEAWLVRHLEKAR